MKALKTEQRKDFKVRLLPVFQMCMICELTGPLNYTL